MVYYGTSVSSSSSSFAPTGYSSMVSVNCVVPQISEDSRVLSEREIKILQRSMEIHKESLSLLGQ